MTEKYKDEYDNLTNANEAGFASAIRHQRNMIKEIRELQTKLDKAIKIKMFRICSHCNKEFEAETTPIMGECIKGVSRGEISNFPNCPFCKKRNDIWVRVQALKGE